MIFNTSTLVSLFVSSFLFLDGATAETCCVALGSTACPAGYQTATMAVTMTTGTICGKGDDKCDSTKDGDDNGNGAPDCVLAAAPAATTGSSAPAAVGYSIIGVAAATTAAAITLV